MMGPLGIDAACCDPVSLWQRDSSHSIGLSLVAESTALTPLPSAPTSPPATQRGKAHDTTMLQPASRSRMSVASPPPRTPVFATSPQQLSPEVLRESTDPGPRQSVDFAFAWRANTTCGVSGWVGGSRAGGHDGPQQIGQGSQQRSTSASSDHVVRVASSVAVQVKPATNDGRSTSADVRTSTYSACIGASRSVAPIVVQPSFPVTSQVLVPESLQGGGECHLPLSPRCGGSWMHHASGSGCSRSPSRDRGRSSALGMQSRSPSRVMQGFCVPGPVVVQSSQVRSSSRPLAGTQDGSVIFHSSSGPTNRCDGSPLSNVRRSLYATSMRTGKNTGFWSSRTSLPAIRPGQTSFSACVPPPAAATERGRSPGMKSSGSGSVVVPGATSAGPLAGQSPAKSGCSHSITTDGGGFCEPVAPHGHARVPRIVLPAAPGAGTASICYTTVSPPSARASFTVRQPGTFSPRWGGDDRSLSPTPRTAWGASPNSKESLGSLASDARNSHMTRIQQPDVLQQQCSGDGLPTGVCIYGGSDARCEPSTPVVHLPLNKARVSSFQSISTTPKLPYGTESPDVTLQTGSFHEQAETPQVQHFHISSSPGLQDVGNAIGGGSHDAAEDAQQEAQFHHLFTGEDVRRRAEAGRCFLALCLV